MTTKSISIGPEKFTIFDSDVSDSESEADEWISVSTSTTISTTSTLPSHLNLNPKSAIKIRPQITDSRVPPPPRKPRVPSPPASSSHLRTPSPPPPPPALSSTKTTPTTVATENPTQPTPREHPITTLKRFLPNLTAIYIVSPPSIYTSMFTSTPTTQQPARPNIYTPLSTLTSVRPNPPISTKATRPSNYLTETYIRICADCAKPPMTIYCDGTWASSGPSSTSSCTITNPPCQTHLPAFQLDPPSMSCKPLVFPPNDKAIEFTCGKCADVAEIIGCLDCARKRDAKLFQAVVDAASPFRRSETEKTGVKVFDMSIPVAGEVYRHVEGCDQGCGR